MRKLFTSALVTLLATSAGADDQVDFMSDIQPILKAHCYKCHGAKKGQGDLRIHSSEGLLEHVVVPGDTEGSELFARLIEEDEELRMPEGSDPLPSESIELIRNWIEQGAEMPEGFHIEVFEEPVIEDSPPASPEALQAIEATGALVLPLASGFNLLTVSFATMSNVDVNDELIAPLSGVAEQVAWLNLAGANVTDDGLATIGQLTNLSKLHLERTDVTDAGLAHLAALEKLEYLNLYGTQVSDAGLDHLKSLPNLKRLYLWQTEVNYDPAMELQAAVDGLVVNLGWDHPGVRRARLTSELERAKQLREDASAREETARAEKEDAARREAKAARELENLERELRGEPPLPEEPAADEEKAESGDENADEEDAAETEAEAEAADEAPQDDEPDDDEDQDDDDDNDTVEQESDEDDDAPVDA